MSDTTTCPNCSATLPAGATFCTSCGTRLEIAAAAPDATRVDTPGLHDATQQYTPPAAPWQPAESAAPPPPVPATPSWQTPPPPAPAAPPTWGAAAAPAPPSPPAGAPWQAPAEPATPWGGAPGQPAWGAPAAAPVHAAAPSSKRSPFGGIVALIGGVLTLVGLLSAWLTRSDTSGQISGWDLTGEVLLADNPRLTMTSKDPYLLLGLGLVALLIGVLLFLGKARGLIRIAALAVGIAIVGIHARDWMSITDVVKPLPSSIEFDAGFGFYLGIAGGVLTALSGLIPGKK